MAAELVPMTDAERRVAISHARQAELYAKAGVEYRAPKAATQSLRWVTPGRAQAPDWDANQAFQYGVYSNVVIYACFEAIANTIASLPWRMGRDPERPTEYDPAHPLARMLNYKSAAGPNSQTSAFDLWQFSIVQFLATGRFGWEIETAVGSDQVVALWPLVSAALVPIASQRGERYFEGFEYGRRDQPKRLTPDQIVYGWKPKGTDYRQPESALEAAHLDISIAVAQSRYDYAFLKNDARPAALVITEEFADEDDYEAFKRQWNSSYGGYDNAGKAAFLEAKGGDNGVTGAVDVKVLGMSAKDTQAAQRYADRLQQIAIALGVPWSRLDASNRTFDNASEEDKIWWQQRLVPLIRRVQSVVNIQLAPRFGDSVGWFDLSQVPALQQRPEPVTQKVGADVLVQARIMTVNEARAEYGLPPITGGDEMLALPAAEPLALNPGPAGSGDAGAGDDPEGDRAPLRPSPPAVRVDLERQAQEVRRARVWDQTDRTVRNLERVWERAFVKLFTTQRNSVLARLESNRGRRAVAGKETRGPADEVFDRAVWTQRTAEEVLPLFEVVVTVGGERVAQAFDLAFDVEAPYAQDFIQARANQLAGQVTDTTHGQIKDALSEGVAAGESIPDLSARVSGVFETATSARATMIARTEVISAYNGSASLTAAQYPSDVVGGMEWIATRDDRVRDTHRVADGQSVPIGVGFQVGASVLAYPGDPNASAAETINCRCTIGILTPDEMAERGIVRMAPKRVAVQVLELAAEGTFEERTAVLALRSAA